MDHGFQIDYKNVTLRPLGKDDIEKLRVWRNDSRNTAFLSNISYITSEMQNDWFQRYLHNNDELCFAVVENKELQRLVGSLSLYQFTNNTCYFGKILIGDLDAHGKKVGVNATIAATKIAFELLYIKQVKLRVFVQNKVAVKVYSEAGFTIIDEQSTGEGRNEYIMLLEC